MISFIKHSASVIKMFSHIMVQNPWVCFNIQFRYHWSCLKFEARVSRFVFTILSHQWALGFVPTVTL